MNRAFFILIFYLCTGLCRAGVPAQQQALTAQSQYDAQQFVEAARSYEHILNDGLYSAELFFNLGNAYFKAGDLPKALLNYRRAWYFTPGDPDLEANTKLAAQTAGVLLPETSLLERITFSLSQERWVHCALIGYLLATGFIVGAIAISRLRGGLLKAALFPFLFALISCLGLWKWHQLYQSREQVLLSPVTAKYGPTKNSTDHFNLPAGSVVRTHRTPKKGWLELDLNQNTGWIKNEKGSPVVLWNQ